MKHPRKVLVVDDSWVIRELISGLLTPAGFDVATAVDGRDGLLKIRRTPDLALVLCDVNMPQLGGLELLDALVRDPLPAPVPILMLTSDVEPVMVQRAKRAGAKGWLVKPFVPDMLLAAVRKLAVGS